MLGVKKKVRLRLFANVFRRDSDMGLKRALLFQLDGKAGKGRPRKTWYEVVRNNMRDLGVCERDALDRNEWRRTVRNAQPTFSGKTAVKRAIE